MRVLSLNERISMLEQDLAATPPRISVYHDLPFAILRYDPEDEWRLRTEMRLLATRLEARVPGRKVALVSLADLLWEAIDRSEGLEAVVDLEKHFGFQAAQEQVTQYLTDADWCPLPDLLAERLGALNPDKDIAFLLRAGAMAPSIYGMSRLLDEMQGRTQVTTILCYPGTLEGTTGLRFMGMADREPMGNYRVKIYG
jgi:hypothetical protein